MKSNYLLYVDFNSLYPAIMSQFKLPMDDFVELNWEELSDFKNQVLTEIDVEGESVTLDIIYTVTSNQSALKSWRKQIRIRF